MEHFVKIDFRKRLIIKSESDDSGKIHFKAALIDGSNEDFHVEISSEEHELLANVYNLAFGPLDENGSIDSAGKSKYADYSSVFSTIFFHAYSYLKHYPDRLLGIDGSTNSQAFKYYTFILKNFEYLNRYFNVYGVKYYVRISRYKKTQYENPFDFEDYNPLAEDIEVSDPIDLSHMYNYFVFKLKP